MLPTGRASLRRSCLHFVHVCSSVFFLPSLRGASLRNLRAVITKIFLACPRCLFRTDVWAPAAVTCIQIGFANNGKEKPVSEGADQAVIGDLEFPIGRLPTPIR